MQSIARPLNAAIERPATDSARAHRIGVGLSTVAALFLGFDSLGKLLEVQPVLEGAAQLGYPPETMFTLGLLLFLSLAVYVIPRTSVAGAVLLTGYLGGAIATHVRVESPLFTHTLFPVYIAMFVWGGLVLRDARVQSLLVTGSRLTAEIPAMQHALTMHATSKDGTAIAYERSGAGPALILVDGALCSRAFGPSPRLAPLLARHFTVYAYDRRGRGQSGDVQPYAKERELEDIAALIDVAGGSAHLLGLSSGGALSLEAAASGLSIAKVVAYEPPYVDEGSTRGPADHERNLKGLLAAGNRGGAVTYFMRSMVGVPAAAVVMMRLMPWIWRKLAAVAHTLPYDAAVMNEFRVPLARFAAIGVPTLVMHGSKTDARLQKAAAAVTAAVPGAGHRTLDGQTHNVKPAVLTPAVVAFLTGNVSTPRQGVTAMRFILMHKTNTHWEGGASPSPELITRVGALIGELAAAKVFHGGEGLRASVEGVRVTVSGGTRTVTKGPFTRGNELPAGFSILRTGSIEEAVDWATNAAALQGAAEIDIRPVTEPWDIGMAPRPEHVTTRRYMALRKVTTASESGEPIPPSRRAGLARLIEESGRSGVHLATETMQPSSRGRRYKNSREGISMTDGPFTETKELIAGYVIVSAASLDEAGRWAARYLTVVGADEVDVRELEDV